MNRKPLVIVSLLVFAVMLIAAGWWLGRHDGGAAAPEIAPAVGIVATTDEREAAPASAGVEAANPAAARVDATTASLPTSAPTATPLPPVDAAVTEVFDELLERARRGDTRAACRLGSDLQRCQRAARMRYSPEYLEQRAAGESDPRRRESMIEYMANMEEQRAQSEQLCAGVTPAQIDMAFALQMQAAQADPDLRLWAALNPALDTQYFLGDLDRWQQYRQVALPWMEAAAAQGDLTAVIALARVFGDSRRPGPMSPPLRMIDDARFMTYAALMERYGLSVPPVQRAMQEARSRLDADTLAAAEARAAALHRPDAQQATGEELSGRAMRRSFEQVPDAADCD